MFPAFSLVQKREKLKKWSFEYRWIPKAIINFLKGLQAMLKEKMEPFLVKRSYQKCSGRSSSQVICQEARDRRTQVDDESGKGKSCSSSTESSLQNALQKQEKSATTSSSRRTIGDSKMVEEIQEDRNWSQKEENESSHVENLEKKEVESREKAEESCKSDEENLEPETKHEKKKKSKRKLKSCFQIDPPPIQFVHF